MVVLQDVISDAADDGSSFADYNPYAATGSGKVVISAVVSDAEEALLITISS